MTLVEYRLWCVSHVEQRDLLQAIPKLYRDFVGNSHIEYISVLPNSYEILIEKICQARARFNGEYQCQIFEPWHKGVHGSWCDWVVIMTDDLEVELEILFDLIHNFGVRG